MNGPIRRVAVVTMLMFAALLINVTGSFFLRHDELASSDYNRRVRNTEFARDRGPIMAGNTALAETKPSNDAMKYQRVYPKGSLYSSITGWFSYNYATSGLERSHDDELAGTADSLALTSMVDRLTGKQPKGATVETTIDPTLQEAALDALGSAQGAIVVMEYKTGAVKALVSTPTYDPNRLASHESKEAAAAWTELNADKTRPLSNRATREIYPPGSTFKVLVSAAALENGMSPETAVSAPATITLPGTNTTLPNQGSACQGKATLSFALQRSCNTAFALIGMNLGEQKLTDMATKFGFGKRHLPELNAVASRFPSGMNKAEIALSSIGQFEVAASPLQMAMVGAGVANDGVVMEPYLVSKVRAPNLTVISEHKPQELGRALSKENAAKLQQMMVNVVEKGSGTRAQIPGMTVGGKTGTAQHRKGEPPYGSFMAIAPEKGLVVYVFVEKSDANKRDANYAGAYIAAPMARQVLKAAR